MNADIKKGAEQLAKGLKAEALETKDKLMARLDANNDGKIDFNELKKEVVGDAKEGVDKLKALASDKELPEKVKKEVNDALAKIKPMIDAAKTEDQEETK